jgi:Cd2+/Zn2+-exporting ATPase
MTPRRTTATLDVPAHPDQGVRCLECEGRICSRVEELDGVLRVDCGTAGVMRVDYDAEQVSADEIADAARIFGAELDAVVEHAIWRIGGLDCPDCARTLTRSVEMLPGVVSTELNFASAIMLVEHEVGTDPNPNIVSLVQSAGHSAEPAGGSALLGAAARPGAAAEPAEPVGGLSARALSWARSHRTEVAFGGSGAFIVLGWLLLLVTPGTHVGSPANLAALGCFLAAVVMGETLLFPRAVASIRARNLDMNVLMTIAVVGATAIGQVEEAATVVFLFAFGGWLEARALSRTRSSIGELMALAPPIARVRRGETTEDVAPDDVAVGEVLLVRPGERIPLDGSVETGVSAIDESAVTGEPVPATKNPGDCVFSGTLNGSGLLEVRVTALSADSTIARIVYLVEEAQDSRAPSQLLVDRFSRIYTPAVVGLAAMVAVLPPALGLALGGSTLPFPTDWWTWLYRGLVVLVAACPCALVISTPVTFVSAIARAGREGVLVKGGAYLELAARLDAVAFDKTGTLTQGRPEVGEVVSAAGWDADRIIEAAASLEAHSTHPLAGAVLGYAASRGITPLEVRSLEEMPGRGVSGVVGESQFKLVSPGFAEEIASMTQTDRDGIAAVEDCGNTALVLIEASQVVGFFSVSDPPRGEAGETIRALRAAGIAHTVLLTGDNERTAKSVAERLELSSHEARLLPDDKVEAVRRLRDRFGTVAMVGDGINDAPALAVADIGVAMGAAGSDTALETADVALLGDDLSALPRFLALGRRTVGIVRANVTFSVAAKVVVLVAAILGRANMWLAVFADTGVALLVILNGMRLLRRSAGSAPVAAKAAVDGQGE